MERITCRFSRLDSEDVEEGVMQVSMAESLLTQPFMTQYLRLRTTRVSQNVYVVEQLTFSEEGTVDIVASEHPCDDDGVSELAKLVAGETLSLRSVPDGFPYTGSQFSHVRPWYYPVKTFKAQNGKEHRILYGSESDRRKAEFVLRQHWRCKR